MGLMDRLHRALTGVHGAMQAPFGMAKDLAFAPFTDDEQDGILESIYEITTRRGGQFLGNLMGPDEGIGALVGGLPERGPLGVVRGGTRGILGPVERGLETAYREGIGEPLSATYLALAISGFNPQDIITGRGEGSVADRFRRLTQAQTWSSAYDAAQTTSPGQSAAYLMNLQPGSDRFEMVSGVMDAVVRFTADPTVIAGKTITAARARTVLRNAETGRLAVARRTITPARGVRDLEAAMSSTQHRRFVRALRTGGDDGGPMNASQIFSQFFSEEANGPVIAAALEDALRPAPRIKPRAIRPQPYTPPRFRDTPVDEMPEPLRGRTDADPLAPTQPGLIPDTDLDAPDPSAPTVELAEDPVDLAVRSMLGDETAIAKISETSAGLAARVQRLTDERAALLPQDADLTPPGWPQRRDFDDPERVAALTAEIDEADNLLSRAQRAEEAVRTLDQAPRFSRTSDLREEITRSAFYRGKVDFGTSKLNRVESAFVNTMSAPLRSVFNMEPQRLINLHDRRSAIHVGRMLRQSGVDLPVQDDILSRYMASANPGERQALLIEAETTAVRHLARNAGMTPGEIDRILTDAAAKRGRTARLLRGREYDATMRSVVRYADDDGALTELHLPVLVTQEANVLPMVNIHEVRRATTAIGRFKLRHPTFDIPEELLTRFMKLWRPSVLLRVGWPLRVGIDEQLRVIAKIGVFAQGAAILRSLPSPRAIPKAIADAKAIDDRGVRASLSAAKRSIIDSETRRVNQTVNVRGYELQGAFGPPGDANNISKALNEARGLYNTQIGQTEKGLLAAMRRETGEWAIIEPGHKDYAPNWERAVNQQIGQDAMARRFLQDQSVEDVVRWLTRTSEGRAHLKRNPIRARDPQHWAEDVANMVEEYTAGRGELKALALEGRASASDLERLVPSMHERPRTHGALLDQGLGQDYIHGQLFNGLIQKAFHVLGEVPTNVLARNPFFDHLYRAEVDRLVGLADDQARAAGRALGMTDLRDIERKSRAYALRESKNRLYDLAERSELAETLRFVSPFFSAWQEVITRWTGIAIENPAFVARMRLALGAPEAAGLVYDENGNAIDENGVARAPLTDEVVEAGADRYVRLPLPGWVSDLPGMSSLEGMDHIAFNKKSMNMLLQGTPGFGPIVQIPVNEIVKDRPDLEDSVKFILPYGTTSSMLELVMPATARRAYANAQGEENRSYFTLMMRVYFDEQVNFNRGLRSEPPSYDEAKERAHALMNVRLFANFVAPVAPTFVSPYQAYIDAYRQAQARLRDEGRFALADAEGQARSADEWFYDTYGADFFPLTQSITRSVDGVPPTVEGWEARERYGDLIEEFPELGGLIVGAEGAGDFSGAVFDHQLATRVAPGDSRAQREVPDFLSASGGPNVREGWLEYRRAMNMIDAEMHDQGLPNLRVKGARQLLAIKQAITAQLEERFPEWAEARSTFDRNAWPKKIEAMKALVTDDRLIQRKEFQGLAEYLEARDVVLAELAARGATKNGAKALDAASNGDLRMIWDTLVAQMVEQNLPFADLYYRHLERDPMEVR